jgi:DNA-directed RNA polymerase specialized sigma24 family protein
MGENSYGLWPPLSEAYVDAFGEIDLEVYNTARKIWPQGMAFARSRGADESVTQMAMMRAVAKVSHRFKRPRPNLSTSAALKAYLFTAFRRCLFEEFKKDLSRGYEVSENLESLSDYGKGGALATQIEKKILLEEIVRHMDPETRTIYEQLVLGLSFEQIAQATGKESNRLRSRFSKRIKKIAAQLTGSPVNIQVDH